MARLGVAAVLIVSVLSFAAMACFASAGSTSTIALETPRVSLVDGTYGTFHAGDIAVFGVDISGIDVDNPQDQKLYVCKGNVLSESMDSSLYCENGEWCNVVVSRGSDYGECRFALPSSISLGQKQACFFAEDQEGAGVSAEFASGAYVGINNCVSFSVVSDQPPASSGSSPGFEPSLLAFAAAAAVAGAAAYRKF